MDSEEKYPESESRYKNSPAMFLIAGHCRVQLLLLETSSSPLYAAPSAIRRQLPTSIVAEEGIGRLIHSTQVGSAERMLRYLANPDNSLSFDRQSSLTTYIPILEDEKLGLIRKSIVTSKESNKMSMDNLSEACDNDMRGLMEDSPSVCMLDSAAGYTVVGLCQTDQYPHDLYAKVKKEPRSSSTNYGMYGLLQHSVVYLT
ncbi:hypothetical protein CHS0354_012802 [Potamilus streckersoni]|uniref:Uncharacterized protein n=1 Tax=Potamilus streckersoni TaxID=2493646 RepID=A0AAE0SX55_9BIVA|nr:hypothetical protein CHS0354_012802 [Potamilus streckersoni]